MQRKGFTLVELLVVITIIGLLAGMLIPAVMGALDEANKSACGSNLKQIGTACSTYASSHKQKWPDVYSPGDAGSTNWDKVGASRPADQVLPGAEPAVAVEPVNTPGPLNSNLANFWVLIANAGMTVDIFLCPSAGHRRDATVTDAKKVRDFRGMEYCSYSYQNVLGPYTLTTTSASQSTQMAVASDANPMRGDFWSQAPGDKLSGEGVTDKYFADNKKFVETDETRPWNEKEEETVKGAWQLNSPNHKFKGQNVLYLDGHVEFKEHPYCGTKFDNIWLGRDPTATTTTPIDPNDLATVSQYDADGASYKDATSKLSSGNNDDSFLVP